ncbi:MAG: hypothetical protein ABI606_01705 [Rhodoferax sp.]
MKTKERTVHFYDLILDSYTGSDGISRPACADLEEILSRMVAAKPIGHPIVKARTIVMDVADWEYDKPRKFHRILINRADSNVSDVTFRDFNSNRIRKAGKTKVEGVESSAHIIVKPKSDKRSALVMMTAGAGVTAQMLERLFTQLTTALKDATGNSDLFAFPHPSNERDSKGMTVTYKVNYKYECLGHKSTVLDDALRNGTFLSMELIAHEHSAFDTGGNLQINEQSISIKAATPSLLTAAGLINAVKAYMKNSPAKQYDNARIRYKGDGGDPQTTTLKTNELDAAFTRKQKVELASEVEAQQTKLHPDIIAAMEKLL